MRDEFFTNRKSRFVANFVAPAPFLLAQVNLMSHDDRDFIQRADSMTEKLYGKPASIGQVADNFALYGLKQRAAALETLDTELRGEVDSSPNNLRRRLQLMELRRKMGGVHEALRKARR